MRGFLVFLLLCVSLNAAAAQQTLRPGDSLDISVFQDPKLDRRIVVGPDGMIGFPLVGQIRAGGLTPRALQDALRGRLQKNYNTPLDVTVSLSAVNQEAEEEQKPKVYITGEVLKPGPYILRPTINVMQAIALAGGLGPFAATKRIQIHRKINGVDSIFVFDFDAYQSGRDPADNVNLKSGDIIIVPERGLLE